MATARAKPKRATEPEQGTSHSGRLLLRMPPSLHAELAEAADREGQSLNAYITGVLADRNGGAQPPDPPASSRVLRTAVIVDLVLVAIAAMVAIALLVVAWP
jgi:HicB family